MTALLGALIAAGCFIVGAANNEAGQAFVVIACPMEMEADATPPAPQPSPRKED